MCVGGGGGGVLLNLRRTTHTHHPNSEYYTACSDYTPELCPLCGTMEATCYCAIVILSMLRNSQATNVISESIHQSPNSENESVSTCLEITGYDILSDDISLQSNVL